MSYYEVLVFLHIGVAAIWIGSAFLFFVLFLHAKSTNDTLLAQRLGANAAWLAMRLFVPAGLSVLVLGILLTIEGPWSFGQLWILLGLGGMATTFLLGLGVIEPTTKKMHAAVEAHGPAHPEVARQNRRLEALGLLDLVLLFAIVWDMVLKPTADDLGTLLVPALALGVAGLYLFRTFGVRAAGTSASRA